MKFIIDPAVFKKFPQLMVIVPIITGFDNRKSGQEALKILRDIEAELKKKFTLDALWRESRVTSYMDCFKSFGINPQNYLPAHVALAKRVLEGGQLPDINPMVNLYNAMSLKYLTPFGGENLESLYGDFVLKLAVDGEQWIPIGGKESKPAGKGELVWRDDYDLSTRALNWRQCNRTKMTQETKNGYFIMDGFADINGDNIKKASEEFVSVATGLFGGKADILFLSSTKNEAEISFTSKILTKKEKMKNKINPSVTKVKPIQEVLSVFESKDWKDQGSIGYQIRIILLKVLSEIFEGKYQVKLDDIELEHPVSDQFGDFTTNIAMVMAGKMKANSRELACKIVGKLNEEMKVNPILENAEVAGPGFINFKLKSSFFITKMLQVVNGGVQITQLNGKKVAVEYTDPNPFKEFHIGHLYSNIIGESVAKIFEGIGATVWRGDFYGDVGMHVAKSVWGMMEKLEDDKVDIKELEKLTINERQKFLGEGYAIGVRNYEEDKEVVEEVKDINYLIYVAAQDLLKKKKGWKPIINYKQYVEGREDELNKITLVYEAGLRWSLEYFESIYKKLGTKFDGYYPESWVGEYGMKLVEKGLVSGVLEKSEGGVVYRGEQDGLHTRVFVNKLGLPTYEAKDLGLAKAKYQDFPYDLSINVFGKEIDEYYKVVRAAMRKIIPDLGKKAQYIAHGMVRLPEGKMSSRTGNVITFEGLMSQVIEQSLKIITNVNLIGEERTKVAKVVGFGAVRYALLRSNLGNDVIFDFEKSISFEGDSGPYLQYTYARCKSVLRKAKNNSTTKQFNNETAEKMQFNTEELNVLRMLYKFEEVVIEAARTFSPNLICGYLFDLAQKYNLFYNKHSILGIDNSQQMTTAFRLALTKAVSIIINQGLNLLGIETVERM